MGWHVKIGVKRNRTLYFGVASIILLAGWAAYARNVDLSTVPKRDTVELTIYNSEDLTLVRETRTITFKKGANPLQRALNARRSASRATRSGSTSARIT